MRNLKLREVKRFAQDHPAIWWPTGTITQASGPRSVLLKQRIKSFSCQPCAHPNSSCQASRGQRGHSLPRFAAGTAVSKWHLTNSTQGLVEPVACDHCTQPCLHWVGGWTEHVPTPVSRHPSSLPRSQPHSCSWAGWELDGTGTHRDTQAPHCPSSALPLVKQLRSPWSPRYSS